MKNNIFSINITQKSLLRLCFVFVVLTVVVFVGISPKTVKAATGPNSQYQYFLPKTEDRTSIYNMLNDISDKQTKVESGSLTHRQTTGDDRVLLRYPYEPVVLIRLKYQGIDGVANATGVYIGHNKILTCGHAVIDNSGKRLEWASVYYQGYAKEGTLLSEKIKTYHSNVQSAYCPKEYADNRTSPNIDLNVAKKYDYGIMVLEETPKVDSGFTSKRELRQMVVADPSENFNDRKLKIAGFPDIRTHPAIQHFSEGTVKQDGNRIYFPMKIEPGNSGSPIFYTNDKGVNVIAGIQTDSPISYSSYPTMSSGVKARDELYDFAYRDIGRDNDNRVKSDRVTDGPISNVIFYYEDGTSRLANGFFVGNRKLITAAHLLTNSKGSKCKNIQYSYNRNGYGANLWQYSSNYTINPDYLKNPTFDNDIAVVNVYSNPKNVYEFWVRESGTINDAEVRPIGYPDDKPATAWYASGHIIKNEGNTFNYPAFTGGMDGSPIVIYESGFKKVVGLQVKTENRNYNTAVLINLKMANWLRSVGVNTPIHDEL